MKWVSKMLQHLQHPTLGEMPLVACPIHLSATPVQNRRAPPTLGEHTQEVLAEWLGR